MKKSLILLLGVTLSCGACTGYIAGPVPPPGPGYYGPSGGVAIAVEDRPYYVHGGGYYSRGMHYRWVGGHWVYRGHRRHWVHGHYIGRG
ncbi:MAG TPA: hypothetical protein VGI85_12600 [Chthoniobacterales bacterium]